MGAVRADAAGPTRSLVSQTRRPLDDRVAASVRGSASGVTRPTVVGIERFDGEADETDRKEDHAVISWVVVDDQDIVSPPDRSHIGVRFDLRVEMTESSTHRRRWPRGQAMACARATRPTKSGVQKRTTTDTETLPGDAGCRTRPPVGGRKRDGRAEPNTGDRIDRSSGRPRRPWLTRFRCFCHDGSRAHESRVPSVTGARSGEPAVVCQRPPVVRSTQFGGRRRSRPRCRRSSCKRGKGIARSEQPREAKQSWRAQTAHAWM